MRRLHDPGKDKAKSKSSRVPGPPGRVGARADVPPGKGVDETQDEPGCLYVRGDDASLAEELEYQLQRQSGTTAGAGKRIAELGTDIGLPTDEPRHGEVRFTETEPLEGGVFGGDRVPRKRKLEVSE